MEELTIGARVRIRPRYICVNSDSLSQVLRFVEPVLFAFQGDCCSLKISATSPARRNSIFLRTVRMSNFLLANHFGDMKSNYHFLL